MPGWGRGPLRVGWGVRHLHRDALPPPGHHYPLSTGPIASCRGTELTRVPQRCLLYRLCLLIEGGCGGSIPAGEKLLAKPFLERLHMSCWQPLAPWPCVELPHRPSPQNGTSKTTCTLTELALAVVCTCVCAGGGMWAEKGYRGKQPPQRLPQQCFWGPKSGPMLLM